MHLSSALFFFVIIIIVVVRNICMRTGSLLIVCAFFPASTYCFPGAVTLHDSINNGGGND